MIRSNAILFPLFSVPGPFGIGVLGEEAIALGKKLQEGGVNFWQVLPVNPCGDSNSPYQCYSSFAGNPLFIDPRPLLTAGLLSEEDLALCYPQSNQDPHRVDYGFAKESHDHFLKLAFLALNPEQQDAMNRFLEAELSWLDDYALFMAIRQVFSNLPWWEWPDEGLKRKDLASLEHFRSEHSALISYYVFEQFIFHQQWEHFRRSLDEMGVRLIGDLPIYSASDSADVWGQREFFEVEADGSFSRVAGVPPDYFSATGQRWGNPLYRWDHLRNNGYSYWIERIRKSLSFYEILRIDHFRGFESYWAIPSYEETAINGIWEKGPAMDLFNVLLKLFPQGSIIAEDLGIITSDVRQFLLETGLPGMKVLQFAFDPGQHAKDRPHDYERNKVAFTGTHDNDTLCSWFKQAGPEQWALIADYFGLPREARENDPLRVCHAITRTLWQSVADLVVVPLQDLLALDSEYRINTPGTIVGNWQVRLDQDQINSCNWHWLRRLNEVCQRL